MKEVHALIFIIGTMYLGLTKQITPFEFVLLLLIININYCLQTKKP